MGVQVGEPKAATITLEMTEEAASAGKWSDPLPFLSAQARGREGREHALFIEHAEGRVLRVRDEPSLIRDPLQHLLSVELAREGKAGRVDRLQLRAFLFESVGERSQSSRVLTFTCL